MTLKRSKMKSSQSRHKVEFVINVPTKFVVPSHHVELNIYIQLKTKSLSSYGSEMSPVII